MIETAALTLALLWLVRRVLRLRGRRRHSWLYRSYLEGGLLSPLWRARRYIWFYSSRRRCEKCGCRISLHGGRHPVATFHHKTYRHLGRERRSEVSMLCWRDHARQDAWRFR